MAALPDTTYETPPRGQIPRAFVQSAPAEVVAWFQDHRLDRANPPDDSFRQARGPELVEGPQLVGAIRPT